MDQEHFDDLTRSVASEGSSRRAVVRLLTASALGGVAARLGLTEVVDATRTRRADRHSYAVPQPEGGKRCPDGSSVLIGDCCPGLKRCGVSSCIPENQCCPGDDSPGCQPCDVEVCVNGEWVCQPTEECGPPYGDSVLASSE